MITHLQSKPSKEKILETINQAAKIEFDFLINGLKVELVNIDSEDIIQLIDRKTKALKLRVLYHALFASLNFLFLAFRFLKMFASFDEKQKVTGETENRKVTIKQDDKEVSKENHQKLVFDDDF